MSVCSATFYCTSFSNKKYKTLSAVGSICNVYKFYSNKLALAVYKVPSGAKIHVNIIYKFKNCDLTVLRYGLIYPWRTSDGNYICEEY
jgi:hypothetical protein